jgi:7-keto-8-aminopelargonate synthetase-like enzyme
MSLTPQGEKWHAKMSKHWKIRKHLQQDILNNWKCSILFSFTEIVLCGLERKVATFLHTYNTVYFSSSYGLFPAMIP